MSWLQAQPFLIALAIGLLLGVERERRRRTQPAGSRTFALLALTGTLATTLSDTALAVGLAAVGALAVVSYVRTSTEDPGTTTEMAMMVAYLLGALTVTRASLAVALAVVCAALLASKEHLHHFVRDTITEVELDDALKFFVVAFVVFPLLPDREMGPYGAVNPSDIWRLVVLLTGIGWLGYLGVRALGPRRGLLLTGLAGGFVSGTATTVSMARLGRSSGSIHAPLAGAVVASAGTVVQLLVVVAVVDRSVLWGTVPAAAAALVLLLISAGLLYRISLGSSHDSSSHDSQTHDSPVPDVGGDPDGKREPRPFALAPALILAVVLTCALLASRVAAETLGKGAVVLTAGVTGLADAHAGVLSAASLAARGDLSTTTALVAGAAALGVNTVVKAVLAFAAGGRRFGLVFVGSIAPAVVAYGLVLSVTIAALD